MLEILFELLGVVMLLFESEVLSLADCCLLYCSKSVVGYPGRPFCLDGPAVGRSSSLPGQSPPGDGWK